MWKSVGKTKGNTPAEQIPSGRNPATVHRTGTRFVKEYVSSVTPYAVRRPGGVVNPSSALLTQGGLFLASDSTTPPAVAGGE